MDSLFAELQNQSIGDWVVLITGVIYVYYASKNNPICWVFGIISCGIMSVMTVVQYGLYADGLLNAFYVVMGIIGLNNWRTSKTNERLSITHIPIKNLILYFIIGVIFSFAAYYFLSAYTSAAATGLDSVTTVFSIIATIWLVKRYVENWMLWIIVDLLYVYLYASRGAYLYLVLMLIYTVIAVRGYFLWKKELLPMTT